VNAILKAQNAYKNSAQPIRTHRDTEYNAFARITRRLRAAARAENSDFKELVGALYDNRKLWTILAGDVAEKDNPLPEKLRAQIIYLAQFTQVHSQKVLARKATADPLIEINIAIMKGLRNMEVGS
jgi:flagellar protein FlaF